MATVKATYKSKDDDGSEQTQTLEVDYDFGENVNAMIDELGDGVVYRHAVSSITVALQNQMRQWMQQGLSEEDIKNPGGKLDEWSPPSGKPRSANKMDKISKLLETLSPEQREQILAGLQD